MTDDKIPQVGEIWRFDLTLKGADHPHGTGTGLNVVLTGCIAEVNGDVVFLGVSDHVGMRGLRISWKSDDLFNVTSAQRLYVADYRACYLDKNHEVWQVDEHGKLRGFWEHREYTKQFVEDNYGPLRKLVVADE